ncbi:flagellar basal body P-ring protein FlgI [Candidatus Magnetaquicoccus inordinatus]|uniref:flagellar basal body P-ring protein FlgI n=1 Tax=Candidatus Magnetaquicoccus inordinatus TaxID=2496818 RepID=UPI00102AA362|nr:flagellar basal body P-ring protein FlgI [Candidatus Magnetaquicoccus inordinatus]
MNATSLVRIGAALLLLLLSTTSHAARLKDVVEIEGVRGNPITGFGLVVGLNGTGDSSAAFTNQSLTMMLERMGISTPQTGVKVKNIASVMVTATLPPFARQGGKLDVTISSLGDSKSLQGGTLILTPLKGADGKIYAVAQGPVSIGGFAVEGAAQSVQKNHPTVGRIAGGAVIEREIPFELNQEFQLQLSLRNPDFTTATRVVKSINNLFGEPLASARDSGTVQLTIPSTYQGKVVDFVSRLENLQVDPDQTAKVVLNERTGTIVMGENVRVSTVALAHGGLSIKITESPQVSQPNARSRGATVVTPKTDIEVKEKDGKVLEMEAGVTLGELVRGLNSIGVTPRDLIAIMQSIKASGALQAELEIL